MISMKRVRLSTAFFCAIALAAVSIAVGIALLGAHGSEASRPDSEAVRGVCAFEGKDLGGLRLLPSEQGDNRFRLTDGNAIYLYSMESESVDLAFYPANMVDNGKQSVTEEEAKHIAARFAEKHTRNFSALTLSKSVLEDHRGDGDFDGEGMTAYEYEWVEVIDGVFTPNSVRISVNPATGKVISYARHYQQVDTSRNSVPVLTLEQSKAIVEKEVMKDAQAAGLDSGIPRTVSFVGEPELRFVVIDGKQLLVWRMIAEAQGQFSDTVGGQYDVDAQTGSIVQESPFL